MLCTGKDEDDDYFETEEDTPEEHEQSHDIHRHVANHHDVERVANRLNKLNHTLEIVEERLRHVENATGVEVASGNPKPGIYSFMWPAFDAHLAAIYLGPSEQDVPEPHELQRGSVFGLSFKL